MRTRTASASLLLCLALALTGGSVYATTARAYLHELKTPEEFLQFAVNVDDAPYTKFVIDVREGKGQIYYFWTHGFAFHYDFVKGVLFGGNEAPVGTIEEFNDRNHGSEDRQFILGAVGHHPAQKVYTFEFPEASSLAAPTVKKAYDKVKETFFDKGLLWRPVGDAQEELRAKVEGVPSVGRGMMDSSGKYQFLNAGRAVGKLRIVPAGEDASKAEYGRDTILVLQELPIDITPCGGVISRQFSTPLSHINLRARAWGIPNIGVTDALEVTKGLEGKWVLLVARHQEYELRLATEEEVAEAKEASTHRTGSVQIPMTNLKMKGLPDLGSLRGWNASAVGAKAANLGELVRNKTENYDVPEGFAIPFAHYADFVKANKLDKKIKKLLKDKGLAADKTKREAALTKLRDAFQKGKHKPAFAKELLAKAGKEPYKSAGLFVRSSTNVEDLHGFNGAGLYTTVPNVVGNEALLEAVKTVWGSLWNLRAFDERDSYRIEHKSCLAGVVVQVGVNADAAGVLITTNVYNPADRETVTINAKRGLGMRVVEGRRVPEQVLYDRAARTMRIISRSDDPIALVFDDAGGVKEVKADGKPVLTEEAVARLAKAATDADQIFGRSYIQDIEWLVVGGVVNLVQARPYVEPKGGH